jgi:hypothetical protein
MISLNKKSLFQNLNSQKNNILSVLMLSQIFSSGIIKLLWSCVRACVWPSRLTYFSKTNTIYHQHEMWLPVAVVAEDLKGTNVAVSTRIYE